MGFYTKYGLRKHKGKMPIVLKAFYSFFNKSVVGNFAPPGGIAKDNVVFLFLHINEKIQLSNVTYDHISVTDIVLKGVVDPCKLNTYLIDIIGIYILALYSLRKLQNEVSGPAAGIYYLF